MNPLNCKMNKFLKLAQPPEKTLYSGDDLLWNSLAENNHMQFPDDYLELIRNYGLCDIADFLWMPNPFVGSLSSNIFALQQTWKQLFLIDFRETQIARKYADLYKNDLLLPCLSTANMDMFFWLCTENIPNEWKIIGISSDFEEYCEYPSTLLDMMIDLLENKHQVPFFPEDFNDSGEASVAIVNEKVLSEHLLAQYPFPLKTKGINPYPRHSREGGNPRPSQTSNPPSNRLFQNGST